MNKPIKALSPGALDILPPPHFNACGVSVAPHAPLCSTARLPRTQQRIHTSFASAGDVAEASPALLSTSTTETQRHREEIVKLEVERERRKVLVLWELALERAATYKRLVNEPLANVEAELANYGMRVMRDIRPGRAK